MRGCLKSLLLLSLFGASTVVLADDEESFTSYDSIVSQLEMAAETPAPSPELNWDEVAMHAGVGFVMSAYNIHHKTQGRELQSTSTLTGFQFNFGMNMFSKQALAEGIFRNYSSDKIDGFNGGYVVNLREFEVRGVYLPYIGDKMKWRLGGGLAERYMSLNNDKASTLFGTLMFGFERTIVPGVSIGPDWSYRSALFTSTFDKSSWDAAIRLNATF